MMDNKTGQILIIDDDEDVLQAARLFLKQHIATVHTDKNPKRIPELLAQNNYDVILLDMNFTRDVASGKEGFFWLDKILKIDPSAVIILITAFGDIEMAVRAIKCGATDFVLKPWQNEKFLATISAGISLRKSKFEVASLKSREKQLAADLDYKFHGFIGQSPAINDVFETIAKVARTEANILILGESGTGKELVAREIHRQSQRADQVFIAVDMGALTETLFESELFGHKKGAFTDAREDRVGRFEIATGGTLFLDEIGNIPVPLQAKLLSVLQNREITRIGSNKITPVDVRLISATNMQLHKMIEDNTFRQDLLYRINTVEIKLAPLRERVEDIPLLVEHFLGIFARKYKKSLKKTPASTLRKLGKYHWPGNVRELKHAVERAVIMSDSDILQPENFFFSGATSDQVGLELESYDLNEVEKEVIRKALGKHQGNVSQAAKDLGLTRTSLYRRMHKYGL
ncbi:MAG: sigma-54-dependent Fis family transcriptional regulator [candidate division Zixibacteria bacterium]|nr:sigma-54-dependent Fis family transcriptional regulator [candidate division Zixibacteria bacterium]